MSTTSGDLTVIDVAPGQPQRSPRPGSDRAFFAVLALVFGLSAAVTIAWCGSMSAIGMPMPGGWTMSMAWMRMPAQTWPHAAASFLVMWIVMMAAMMLPSLVPMLWRYRQAVERTGLRRLERLCVLAGAGYAFVWTLLGAVAYPVGVTLSALAMRHSAVSRAVPLAAGIVVMTAGFLQFTPWKAHHLGCCRRLPDSGRALSPDAMTAWRHGVRMGFHCSHSSAGLMMILLVTGVMDPWAMALVTSAITIERLAPAGLRIARAIGAGVAGTGLFLTARAAGLG